MGLFKRKKTSYIEYPDVVKARQQAMIQEQIKQARSEGRAAAQPKRTLMQKIRSETSNLVEKARSSNYSLGGDLGMGSDIDFFGSSPKKHYKKKRKYNRKIKRNPRYKDPIDLDYWF